MNTPYPAESIAADESSVRTTHDVAPRQTPLCADCQLFQPQAPSSTHLRRKMKQLVDQIADRLRRAGPLTCSTRSGRNLVGARPEPIDLAARADQIGPLVVSLARSRDR